jgi:hypothetical protein
MPDDVGPGGREDCKFAFYTLMRVSQVTRLTWDFFFVTALFQRDVTPTGDSEVVYIEYGEPGDHRVGKFGEPRSATVTKVGVILYFSTFSARRSASCAYN